MMGGMKPNEAEKERKKRGMSHGKAARYKGGKWGQMVRKSRGNRGRGLQGTSKWNSNWSLGGLGAMGPAKTSLKAKA